MKIKPSQEDFSQHKGDRQGNNKGDAQPFCITCQQKTHYRKGRCPVCFSDSNFLGPVFGSERGKSKQSHTSQQKRYNECQADQSGRKGKVGIRYQVPVQSGLKGSFGLIVFVNCTYLAGNRGE